MQLFDELKVVFIATITGVTIEASIILSLWLSGLVTDRIRAIP